MKSIRREQVRERLRRNDQQGFTLIELLVVISILGILAAVVTMSLVGITSRAQANANSTELHTVQAALDTMLADQQTDASAVCGGGATKNMNAFPPGGTVHLYPDYIRQQTTSRSYACSNTNPGAGTVSQSP